MLGRRVAALLDTEAPVPGVTVDPEPGYAMLGRIGRDDGEQLDPAAGDLAVTANWGYTQESGAVMPGSGDFRPRKWSEEERETLGEEAAAVLAGEGAEGAECYDVYLNGHARWAAVPGAVWDLHLGGYQVLKKWLSYRQRDVLGRDLSASEAREVTAMVRRLAGLVLMRGELDENYTAVKEAPYDWPGTGGRSGNAAR